MKSLITKRSRSCLKCGSKNLVDYKFCYWQDGGEVLITRPLKNSKQAFELEAGESHNCADCGERYAEKYIDVPDDGFICQLR